MMNVVGIESVVDSVAIFKWKLRNEICEVLSEAGEQGMTPTQLTEALWDRGYPNYTLSLQKVVGNVAYMPRGLVKRVEIEDKEHSIKVKTSCHTYIPTEDGTYRLRPAGTEIEVPTKKVVYVWVG